mmetsp:Transcript_4830/g.15436  ORF Transcript_4830/g.15436 Transcript_4830/m.15436 type:complete len:233 (-) Transcript_4830:889-1587(-)
MPTSSCSRSTASSPPFASATPFTRSPCATPPARSSERGASRTCSPWTSSARRSSPSSPRGSSLGAPPSRCSTTRPHRSSLRWPRTFGVPPPQPGRAAPPYGRAAPRRPVAAAAAGSRTSRSSRSGPPWPRARRAGSGLRRGLTGQSSCCAACERCLGQRLRSPTCRCASARASASASSARTAQASRRPLRCSPARWRRARATQPSTACPCGATRRPSGGASATALSTTRSRG